MGLCLENPTYINYAIGRKGKHFSYFSFLRQIVSIQVQLTEPVGLLCSMPSTFIFHIYTACSELISCLKTESHRTYYFETFLIPIIEDIKQLKSGLEMKCWNEFTGKGFAQFYLSEQISQTTQKYQYFYDKKGSFLCYLVTRKPSMYISYHREEFQQTQINAGRWGKYSLDIYEMC